MYSIFFITALSFFVTNFVSSYVLIIYLFQYGFVGVYKLLAPLPLIPYIEPIKSTHPIWFHVFLVYNVESVNLLWLFFVLQ